MAVRKRRIQKDATLVYGEGSDDGAWIKYLKSIFGRGRSGIKPGHSSGGSPVDVLEEMTKRREFQEYKYRYALVDSDRPETEQAKRFAKKNEITLIISKGCLEYELLLLYGAPEKVLNRAKISSDNAKTEFKKICKRHTNEEYRKAFPESKLKTARLKNEWLDKLISIFE